MTKIIPAILSLDIHCYPDTEKELPLWFDATLKLLDNFSMKATFFFPAIFAEQFPGYVRTIRKEGHEIGCHGLYHDIDEQYTMMPYEKQKSILCEAKKRIEEITSEEVISFRSPIFKVNGDTIRALEENGFKVDSSINSQRLGIFSSDFTNIGWMYSPRMPYHPAYNNPFIRGTSSLWEVPLSAFIFPFMSNTGMAFGETFMNIFYRMFYLESTLTGKPIVYMFHPEDIYPERDKTPYRFKWIDLIPSKKVGFKARKILYNKTQDQISKRTISSLKMMRDSKNVRFVTYREMVDSLSKT